MEQALYKIWEWYETPYNVLLSAPWDKGTWVIRVDREGGFPYHEIDFRQHEEWEVEKKIIDESIYYFIKNPNYIPWPDWKPADLF